MQIIVHPENKASGAISASGPREMLSKLVYGRPVLRASTEVKLSVYELLSLIASQERGDKDIATELGMILTHLST